MVRIGRDMFVISCFCYRLLCLHHCNNNYFMWHIVEDGRLYSSTKMTLSRKAVEYRGPKHWNDLSNTQKKCEKIEGLKKMISSRKDVRLYNHPT